MQCTRVAKSGVLAMENLSSRPGDCNRYSDSEFKIWLGMIESSSLDNNKSLEPT